uniref:Uncharacterized protein n=1 Tax=Grammatophora oceanica TaxID=210454 RepID=A0A7S1VC33_9STRA|mmetsp:Transcript_41148/g.60932  ORF Transcript_41148/g.60932 Transcript_41148/m.60932 type:complete len:213 (+) Transcript_41148:157-795(+)|eukprot:CAMPEP_0194028230 /NCGR_PEP_ID=MMETSP0009_2-20130614/2258_1 /TAXON_ID=210454 /ORGANISM="Grammatophora oceanica, Strain CCMP 410" /LENGTH=212 /DNA_ID=CAMNT_0038667563 /DNA_START=157 /DNA_END=795 /DNA_ORIENTATION=+
MKLVATLVASLVCSAGAFVVQQQQRTFGKATALSAQATSRRDFMVQIASTGVASLATAIAAPGAANAAKYGGFGAGSPEVIDPSEAIIDDDVLKSDTVQKALNNLKAYLGGVKKMQEALVANAQTDVGPYVRKNFDFVALRSDLNAVNAAFDEDTQRGTDRLIRAIMQDITEVETANRQPEGVARSDRRLEILVAKLDKLEKAFSDYLAFAA